MSGIVTAEREMIRLTQRFLETLAPEQAPCYPFTHRQRFDWHYIPRQRAGLHLRDMDERQVKALDDLLHLTLSEAGYRKVERIRQLEDVLARMHPARDYHSGNYAITVFGQPGRPPWGWRLEGHHLSLNVTLAGDGRIAAVPLFTGANPAHVHSGPLAGLRTLAAEQDLAFQVLHGLSDPLREQAIIATESPGDIVTGPLRDETLTRRVGVPLGDMEGTDRDQALRLIDTYLNNLCPDIAQAQRQVLEQADLSRVCFAWAGSLTPGMPHYYRLHGPRLLIEFDNTQNDANHIHTVCRDPENDFGMDWLTAHYREGHGQGV